MHDQLVSIVLEAIASVADTDGLAVAMTADTALYGEGGFLDSIGLVSLIVAVEQAIEENYGPTLVLASEKAMSRRHSPFATVATLVRSIEVSLAEANSHG